jgi:hypothetical protein
MHLTQLFHYRFANWGAFTHHKMILGSIWQVYSTEETNKSLLSFESIDNALK